MPVVTRLLGSEGVAPAEEDFSRESRELNARPVGILSVINWVVIGSTEGTDNVEEEEEKGLINSVKKIILDIEEIATAVKGMVSDIWESFFVDRRVSPEVTRACGFDRKELAISDIEVLADKEGPITDVERSDFESLDSMEIESFTSVETLEIAAEKVGFGVVAPRKEPKSPSNEVSPEVAKTLD